MLLGCNEEEQFATQQQPIVFGQRNVETTRGLFELSRKSNFEQELAYNLATLSRTTAAITLSRLDPEANCAERTERAYGTLFMTSDTRALSAFHVIRADQTTYGVEFEGTLSQMWGDTPGQTGYPAASEWRTDLRHPNPEEFPFLANRLFALGLTSWANRNNGLPARIHLRTGWRFDLESIPASDPHHVQGTLWGQGFLPLLPTSAGKDIVLLNTRQLDPPDWDGIRPFPLLSPSVFFDQVEVAKPEFGFPSRNGTLESVYVSPFFPDDRLVPTSCTNGTYHRDLPNIRDSICPRADVTPQDRIFSNRHGSSLDSAPGTSGGAILGLHREPIPDGHDPYRWRQAFGVLSGVTYPDGVEPVGWGEPNQDPARFSTAFTSIGRDWNKTDRDGPIPAVPAPVFGTPDQHPGCTSWEPRTHEVNGQSYTATVCVKWGESTGEGSVTNGLAPPDGDPIENENPDTPQHDTYFKVYCGRSYPVQTPNGITIQSDPGAMVGLFGAMHLGVNGNQPQPRSILNEPLATLVRRGGGIGSFFQICGPHSSQPFTSNWRFLRISGNTIHPEWETLRGPISWMSLRRALVTKFEERGLPDTTYFRPPSFKTCPPGYLLNGFKLGKSPTHYNGIEELICVLPDGKGSLEVSTRATPEASFNVELFGRPFSLSQFIGAPGVSSDIATAQCLPQFPIMRGLAMAHDKFGRLTYVRPFCTTKVLP